MNILHVDTGREWRGGQAQVFNLIKYLPEEVESHLLTPTDSELSRRIRDVLPNDRIHTHALRGEWDLSAGWKLRNLHKNHDFDLIHAHSSHALGIAWLSSLFFSLPPYIETRRLEKPAGQNWLSARKYHGAARHIAISEAVKQSLRDHTGIPEDRIHVIPSGVDLNKIQSTPPNPSLLNDLGIDPSKPLIGNVGALTEQKDHATLLRAARLVVDKRPDVTFVIAGEGDLREDLLDLRKELGLEEHVVFAGFVDDIIGLIKCFDLFVLTSIFEGLCSTLLQVMASRVPIVATDVGGVPELIDNHETGRLIPPGNPERTAEVVLASLSTPDQMETVVEEAFERVQTYRYESISTEVTDSYQSLIGQRS